MISRLRARLLRTLRVPPAPDSPLGSAASTRVFRAAPGFFYRRLFDWGSAQLTVIGSVAFGFGFTFGGIIVPEWLQELGGDYLGYARALEIAWIVFVGLQLVVSLLILRLDYELRWYIVTDRSLRIREGIIRVREQTVSFANIQNVSVKQGPLQRLLKIADVEIQTAGGGSGGDADSSDHLHRAVFRGVDNAGEIRDLIRHDLQRLRAEGNADEAVEPATSEPVSLVAAARQFADAAASVRAALS